MRRLTVMAFVVILGALGANSAYAATPRAADDQYGTTPVIGSGVTVTTSTSVPTPTTSASSTGEPTTPDSGGTDPASGSGGNTSSMPGKTTSTSSTSPGTGSGSASGTTGAPTGPPANRVAVIEFGRATKKTRQDIATSIDQAGLQTLFLGKLTKKRFDAFLAGPILSLLSPVAVGPAGQAFGAQLVNVSPVAQQAFPALFGRDVPFVPVIRAVLTRRSDLSPQQVAFLKGVATGLQSTGIPLAYVERTDVKKSYVDAFKKLHVLTVKDVDTAAGKSRLAKILLGQITTQQAVDAVKINPASQVTTDANGSTGATPWVILAILGGGAAFMASGTVRRRRGRGIA